MEDLRSVSLTFPNRCFSQRVILTSVKLYFLDPIPEIVNKDNEKVTPI